ncbi:MAG: hypothetical protein IT427_18915 [Pirellulales bacterium]|nr:hypothetical protein [Pirellulales bacterium]
MDKIELALRRYQQLALTAQSHRDVPVPQMRAWLRNEVCRAIAVLVPRPTFRRIASWPIATLQEGAETDERRLVVALDVQIRDVAARLQKLLASKRIEEKLKTLVPVKQNVVAETVTISDKGSIRNAVQQGRVDDLAIQFAQLKWLTQSHHEKLVNINDYLSPQAEWVLTGKGKLVQRGATLIGLNPDLPPVGNFVVLRLMKRIEERAEILRFFRVQCAKAVGSGAKHFQKQVGGIVAAGKELDRLVGEARTSFQAGPEVDVRDACVTAIQIYAAFSPRSDLDWLGLPGKVVEADRILLASRLTNLCNAQLLDRVAAALHELQNLAATVSIKQNTVDDAVAAGGLVLVDHARAAYWEQHPVHESYTKREWRFLLALTKRARAGQPMSVADIEDPGQTLSESVMSTTWGRLKRKLPVSLRRLVAPSKQKRSTYLLHLRFDQVQIFS